tara:strand:- start:46397 stop:46879 length:483 start_codon:yes stop_codon:yes gene_type:complete
MEHAKKLLNEANESLKRADHLASVTFKLINDPKLLWVALENTHKAAINCMNSLLQFDYIYKRIPHIPEVFKEKLRLFKETTAKRYTISRETIILIADLQELVEKHKASSMEFVRKDKFVIASQDYRLRTLDIKKVKDFVEKTKMFINKANLLFKSSDRRS